MATIGPKNGRWGLDFGRSRQLLRNEIFDPSTPSKNGGRMEGGKMVFLVAITANRWCQIWGIFLPLVIYVAIIFPISWSSSLVTSN